MDQLRELLANLRDLPALIKWAGYFGLTAIVFAETGLLVGFFLPGDSLLVTAGLLSAKGLFNVYLLGLLVNVAAAAGNSVGYLIGRHTGPRIFTRDDSLLFNKKHVFRAPGVLREAWTQGDCVSAIHANNPNVFASRCWSRANAVSPIPGDQRTRHGLLGMEHAVHWIFPGHIYSRTRQAHRNPRAGCGLHLDSTRDNQLVSRAPKDGAFGELIKELQQ